MKLSLNPIYIILLSICSFFFSACLVEEDYENTLDGSSAVSSEASGSSFSASQFIYVNLTDGKVSEDNSTWSTITTTKTKLLNETVKVDYTEDDSGNSTNLIRINLTDTDQNTGVYLTGTMTTGGVKIQTSTDYEAGIYLNGATITSSSYPCIDITKGGNASVFLVAGTTNTLTDGRSWGTGYGEEYSTTSGATYTDDDGETATCTVTKAAVSPGSDSKGTICCKGSMAISGSGSLSITQGYKNCIASKNGVLTIESGTYDLTSTAKNGLFAYTGVIVDGGSITFSGTGSVTTGSSGTCKKANAIKTDSDNTSAYVKINGGTLDLTASYGKGINSDYVYVTGGTTNIEVSGTSVDSKSITYYDADGVKTTDTVSFSAEGIEGEYGITVSGGSTIIDAVDDGVNVSDSSGALSISGGFLYVAAQGDGLDSNGTVTVSGGVSCVCTYPNDNSPIDYVSSCKVTGGKVFVIGKDEMSETTGLTSSIKRVTFSASGNANTYFAINDSSGNNIVACKVPYAYTMAMYIDSSLSGSYTAYKNATVSGTEYVSGTDFYLPADSASGTSAGTATASTSSSSSSSSSSNTPGSSSGPGNRN